MKKYLSLIYKVMAIMTAAYGLFLNFEKSSFSRMIVYFTILNNIFVLIFFIFQIIIILFKITKTQTYYIVNLSLIVNILITMFAFEFVVRPYVNFQTGYTAMNLRDTFVHLIIPILTFFNYILFDEKGKFNYEQIKYTAISPIIYLIFCMIYENLGGRFTAFKQISKYPYIFMDFETLGYFAVLSCILVILIFFGVAWLIIFIDQHLSKKSKNKKQP